MDIKQGCLTFRTNIFWELFHEMYEIGAAPIFERGSLSQYLILICHIKASVCHIRLHPWKLLAFTWQQAPWIIALNMESLLLPRRKRIYLCWYFQNQGKETSVAFSATLGSGAPFSTVEKSYGCYFQTFPTVEESYFQTCSCTLSQDMLMLPSTVSTWTALQQRALACWIPSKESTAWNGPRRQIEAKWGKGLERKLNPGKLARSALLRRFRPFWEDFWVWVGFEGNPTFWGGWANIRSLDCPEICRLLL